MGTDATAFDALSPSILSAKRWGGRVRLVAPTQTSTFTTRLRVLANNPKRVAFIVQNQGPGECIFGISDPNLNVNGISLGYRGGTIIMTVDEDGEIVFNDWWVRSGGAGSNCTVWEIERV